MGTISFYFEDVPKISFDLNLTRKLIRQLIIEEGKIYGNITFVFCSDEYLLNMNREYLKHDYLTDVITFDYCEGEKVSGDIFISLDRVKENADLYNETFNKEFYRVMFHGVLHLAGYNDKSEVDKVLMRNKEDYYLIRNLDKINVT